MAKLNLRLAAGKTGQHTGYNMDELYARENWLKAIDHATNIKELIEAKEL